MYSFPDKLGVFTDQKNCQNTTLGLSVIYLFKRLQKINSNTFYNICVSCLYAFGAGYASYEFLASYAHCYAMSSKQVMFIKQFNQIMKIIQVMQVTKDI